MTRYTRAEVEALIRRCLNGDTISFDVVLPLARQLLEAMGDLEEEKRDHDLTHSHYESAIAEEENAKLHARRWKALAKRQRSQLASLRRAEELAYFVTKEQQQSIATLEADLATAVDVAKDNHETAQFAQYRLTKLERVVEAARNALDCMDRHPERIECCYAMAGDMRSALAALDGGTSPVSETDSSKCEGTLHAAAIGLLREVYVGDGKVVCPTALEPHIRALVAALKRDGKEGR